MQEKYQGTTKQVCKGVCKKGSKELGKKAWKKSRKEQGKKVCKNSSKELAKKVCKAGAAAGTYTWGGPKINNYSDY